MKTIRIAVAISLFVILLSGIACWKKLPKQTVSRRGVPFGIVIALPRDVNNAEPEPAVLNELAVIVSVPVADQFYVGPERFPRDAVEERIYRLFKGHAETNRIVYVAGGALVEYREIVQIIASARKAGATSIGLLVDQQRTNSDAPSLFRVEFPEEPRQDEDITLYPDPLKLVVSISGDLKLTLNQEPMGEATDTAKLIQMLTNIFETRKGQRAYKPGMEMRSDVPEDDRVEKTIVVKALRSTSYGHVVQVIDAIRGTGANPIFLQIDDLK